MNVGSTATVNAVLKVGAASGSVTVTSDASQLQSESSDVGFTCAKRADRRPSAPVQRDGSQSLAIRGADAGLFRCHHQPSSTATSFKLNGGQESSVDILVDGATTEMASANIQMNYGFSVEAVQEFKVMTNTFDAQFGSASGGVVNLASKQGTNDFHGSAYDLLKNRVLDADSWLNDYQNAALRAHLNNQAHRHPERLWRKRWRADSHSLALQRQRQDLLLLQLRGLPANQRRHLAAVRAHASHARWRLLVPSSPHDDRRPDLSSPIIYDYTTCTGANQGQACQAYPDNKITEAPDPVFAAASKVMPSAPSGVTSPYYNINDDSSNHEQADMWNVRIDENINSHNKISASVVSK